MRVAFVTVGNQDRRTGGYLYNAKVLAALRKRGVEVEEIVPCGASPEEQEAASHLSPVPDLRPSDVIVVDALARIVCASWIDRWLVERPVVAMVHELPSVAASEEVTHDEREYEQPLLRADRLISVSEHGKSILQARGAPAARIRVVSPGFDRLPLEKVRSSPAVAGGVRTLCVSQWIPRKGIVDLVRAWALRERPGASLELVGETGADPAYAASVRAAVADATGVTVSGCVDDAALGAAYAAADLFVLPSRYEGYGIVYAEALAHGLPVVACNVGPVPELVGEVGAALLVKPGDVGALSGALDLLLTDTALRERMSAAALSRAKKLPRWEDTTGGFLRVLEEAVARRSRGPV